ncbi:MAG: sulfur oxidation c-type cytochrome SoxX [Burkholderiaceae bacterium]|nr:sulfur oxidation c-type cytochrome SoxX [Burkholderiaceae bacterium]
MLSGAWATGWGSDALAAAGDERTSSLRAYRIVGDSIPQPLSELSPDPVRGRAIVADRQSGMCLLCHSGPFPEERSQGDLAPSLDGAGARWSAGQLRLRIVDSRRIVADSLMPSYYRNDGLARVAPSWAGKPVLDAAQVEDVVAFLATLRGAANPPASPAQGPAAPGAATQERR